MKINPSEVQIQDRSDIKLEISEVSEMLRLPALSYRQRKLKEDVEEYILRAAESIPDKQAITINLKILNADDANIENVTDAINQHFRYRKSQSQKKLKRVLRYGWRMLFIALGILAVIFTLTEIAHHLVPENNVVMFIRESFIILGWVALWRPMEMLLYEWHPIKKEIQLFSRLENSNVNAV